LSIISGEDNMHPAQHPLYDVMRTIRNDPAGSPEFRESHYLRHILNDWNDWNFLNV
jgi:hypothetical protein